jgi:hypothetical protein
VTQDEALARVLADKRLAEQADDISEYIAELARQVPVRRRQVERLQRRMESLLQEPKLPSRVRRVIISAVTEMSCRVSA